MHLARLLCLPLVAAAWLLACRTEPATKSTTEGAPSTQALAPAQPVAVMPAEPTAEELAKNAQLERHERYAAQLDKPDMAHCTSDFGIELNHGLPSDQSRRAFLVETLRLEPELVRTLTESPGSGFFRVLGKRQYGRPGPDISADVFLLRCVDHAACRAFAGLYQRVAEKWPAPFCGSISPHATSAEMPLPVDKLLITPQAQPHATCGRYRACLAFAGEKAAPCTREINAARACAELDACDAGLVCFGKALAEGKAGPVRATTPTIEEGVGFGF